MFIEAAAIKTLLYSLSSPVPSVLMRFSEEIKNIQFRFYLCKQPICFPKEYHQGHTESATFYFAEESSLFIPFLCHHKR